MYKTTRIFWLASAYTLRQCYALSSSSLHTPICTYQACTDRYFCSCPLHWAYLAEITCKNLCTISSENREDGGKGECCPKKCTSGKKWKCFKLGRWQPPYPHLYIVCVRPVLAIGLRASLIVSDLAVNHGRTQSFLLTH